MPRQPHTRVTMLGALGPVATPFEIFSMSLAYAGNHLGDAQGAITADVAAACSAYFGRSTTHIAPFAHLTQIAFAYIGADGKQVGETRRLSSATTGGGVNRTVPSQIALRVSLGSGLRGRSQRGGFYLPVPDLQISTGTGQFGDQEAQEILASTVALVNGVQTATGVDVVIPSSVDGNVPVNVVRVGKRLDVIRRRANAIPEGYVAATI